MEKRQGDMANTRIFMRCSSSKVAAKHTHTLRQLQPQSPTHTHPHTCIYIYLCMCICMCKKFCANARRGKGQRRRHLSEFALVKFWCVRLASPRHGLWHCLRSGTHQPRTERRTELSLDRQLLLWGMPHAAAA